MQERCVYVENELVEQHCSSVTARQKPCRNSNQRLKETYLTTMDSRSENNKTSCATNESKDEWNVANAQRTKLSYYHSRKKRDCFYKTHCAEKTTYVTFNYIIIYYIYNNRPQQHLPNLLTYLTELQLTGDNNK